MAYNPAIPQANDRIRDSQPQILENFTVINRAWEINHVSFDDADEGKHAWVTFPIQAADPATLVNEVAVYSKNSALSGNPELFLRRENNGTFYEFTTALQAAEGWTRLASGILLKWGTIVGGTFNGLSAYNYPVDPTIPVFATAYTVLASTYYTTTTDQNAVVRLVDFNTTRFRVYASQRTAVADSNLPGCTYLAIGN